MKGNNRIGKPFRFLYSMKSGIVILVLIVAACTAGSLILQEQIPAYYEMNYGGAARWIMAFGLDRVFTSWWFLVLTGLLCINLTLCSVVRFGVIWRESGRYNLEDRKQKLARSLEGADEADIVWEYRRRRRAGLWGPWLCHVGMLLLIAGFALGERFGLESYVYGVPGQEKELEGTGYVVRIDDFRIELREDETVEQYTASLTVRETDTGRQVSGMAQVNHPMDAFGMRVYQNSTGWACQVDVYQKETLEESRLLCTGEILTPESAPEVSLVFQKFYPDFAYTEQGAVSVSSRLDNPCAAFTLYYDGKAIASDVVGVGYEIIAEPYRFVFRDPQPYTLIQVLRDPFQWLAGLGGALLLISLFLCFYFRPEEWCSARTGDGREYSWYHSRGTVRIRAEEPIGGNDTIESVDGSPEDGMEKGGTR
ncbi:MAG: cytochrome c biogenesis protein ResB [Lachnospiraceae bacterium]|jgi:cytochrome c biogenesis protein|nr:cytochrome c biogenesis protein ResB [Lachnospiraceae bacterium]